MDLPRVLRAVKPSKSLHLSRFWSCLWTGPRLLLQIAQFIFGPSILYALSGRGALFSQKCNSPQNPDYGSVGKSAGWQTLREGYLARSIPTFQLGHLVTTSLDRLEIQCDGRCVQTCEGHSTSEARHILLAIPGSRLRVTGTHSRSKV